jgi:hypothetical protein
VGVNSESPPCRISSKESLGGEGGRSHAKTESRISVSVIDDKLGFYNRVELLNARSGTNLSWGSDISRLAAMKMAVSKRCEKTSKNSRVLAIVQY